MYTFIYLQSCSLFGSSIYTSFAFDVIVWVPNIYLIFIYKLDHIFKNLYIFFTCFELDLKIILERNLNHN